MNAPFDRPELMWTDLAVRIGRAHSTFGGADTGPDPADLDARLSAAVAAARVAGDPSISRLPGVAAADRIAFDAAFLAADALFGAVGVPVPEPGEFTAAGLSFAGLAAVLVAASEDGVKGVGPASVGQLVPVLAPHGLGAKWWQARFAALRADDTIAGNPLRSSADGDGLALAADVLGGFRAFDAAPEGARTGRVPVVVAPRSASGAGGSGGEGSLDGARSLAGLAGLPVLAALGDVEWTLRLIPAGPVPVHLNLNHRAGAGEHPTLPEMLALQARKITSGEPPVDAGVFTWLAGTIEDGRIAARHVWDDSIGVVRISCREIGNQGNYLGVRPPISAQ